MSHPSTARARRFPADTVPVVALAATTATALLAAPVIADRLAGQFGLRPTDIGLYFAVEQAGMCLATLPATWWLRHLSWRRAAAVAMVVFILANLASAQITEPGQFAWLLPLRAVSALAGGTLMVLSMTLAGRSPQRERLFALWTLGQLVAGASLLWLLPRAFEAFGLTFLYLLLAGAMTANLALLRTLPAQRAVENVAAVAASSGSRTPRFALACGIGGILFYYIGFGGLWPFLSAIGRSAGIAPTAGGGALAVASLCGMAGASLAAARSGHGSRRMLAAGYAIHGVALLVLLGALPLARFTLAVCLLKAASNFTLPFILGRVARLDDGRGMGLVNMAIGGGLAIGPAISGGLIEATGGFTPLIAVTLAWMIASLTLVLRAGAPPAQAAAARAAALPA